MAISQNYPSEGPNLYLNFASSKTLDPRLSFSRASTGTYVDDDGLIKTAAINRPRFDHNPVTGECLGLLVEPARTNFVRQSIIRPDLPGNTYSFWTSFISGTRIIPYAELSPDGTFTAALVENSTTATGDMLLRYEISLGNVSGLVDSIWIKAVSGTVTVAMFGSPTAQDITTNVTFGTQWTRISMRRASSANYFLKLIKISSAPVSFYVWGGQCESGNSPTSYIQTLPIFTGRTSVATYYNANGIIETAGIGVARNNAYFPDNNGIMRLAGLLIEPAGTNLATYSEDFTNAVWTGAGDVNIIANDTISPDGSSITADYVYKTDPTNQFTGLIRQFDSLTSNITYTFSFFHKAKERDIANIAALEPNSTTFITGLSKNTIFLANGWKRTYVSYNIGNRTSIRFKIELNGGDLWSGTQGYYIWGGQLEVGNYATSYIPTGAATATRSVDSTSSSTATRSSDIVSLSNTSNIVNPSGGTLLSLSNQTSSVIDSSNLFINPTSLPSTNSTIKEVLYYPTVLSSSTIKQMRSFPSFVTNGLQLHLDAANTSSYSGSGNTWRDLSGNGNNGTLINGVGYDSNNDGSLSFDGINDYVTLGNDKFKYQGNFTVQAVARFLNLPNNPGSLCTSRHPIIYNHDFGYNILINSTGFINFQIYNTVSTNVSANSLSSVIGSNFFHVVGVKNGTLVSLYVNGVLHSSQNLTTSAVYYINEPFVIGGFALCGSNRFYATGNISNVQIYNRALITPEVQQNFNALRSRYGI